jgi:hypothetical protein
MIYIESYTKNLSTSYFIKWIGYYPNFTVSFLYYKDNKQKRLDINFSYGPEIDIRIYYLYNEKGPIMNGTIG